MKKILFSACLLGHKVRYDGNDLLSSHPIVEKWRSENRIVSICPEVSGGLPTPRAPAEIQNNNNLPNNEIRVQDNTGKDISESFIKGAEQALKLCIEHGIKIAVLTESSPSCGSHQIYNGGFSGTKITGKGVTTTLLESNGIRVFSQHQIEEAESLLKECEAP